MSKDVPHVRSIARLLDDFVQGLQGRAGEVVRVADIAEAFHERGFGVLLLFFALPMALPVPVPPVINVVLALPLLVLTGQQAVGRHTVWLPGFVLKKTMGRAALQGVFAKVIPFLRRLEALTRPRLIVLTGRWGQILTGVFGFIMALSVTIPLPLTNTVPSFGIAVMALGVLMRDGLAVCVGALIGMVWVSILVGAFILFGMEGFEIIKDFIKSLLGA